MIEKQDDSDIIKAMKAAGREYIEKSLSDFEPQMLHKISTVLHPLLKNIAMASHQERIEVYNAINQRIKNAQSNETMDIQFVAMVANQDILDEFMGCDIDDLSQSSAADLNEEFNRYLNSKVPPTNPYEFNLLEWWFKNRHTFPNVFRLFLSLAGITASSSPSERSFSSTGIIITARRASLLPRTVSDLVLARNIFLNYL